MLADRPGQVVVEPTDRSEVDVALDRDDDRSADLVELFRRHRKVGYKNICKMMMGEATAEKLKGGISPRRSTPDHECVQRVYRERPTPELQDPSSLGRIHFASPSPRPAVGSRYRSPSRTTHPECIPALISSLHPEHNAARLLGSGVDVSQFGDEYLLDVDNPLVIPTGKKVRFLLTAADVIHAWWVPDFGGKKDAIPGYVNEFWFKPEETGIYRGQCAELCGRDHGFMPVVVHVVTQDEYQAWLADQTGGLSVQPAVLTTETAAGIAGNSSAGNTERWTRLRFRNKAPVAPCTASWNARKGTSPAIRYCAKDRVPASARNRTLSRNPNTRV